MSSDGSATERLDLDALVHRARDELRGWTDRTDGDPGVALLDLFALVGDLLAGHTERLADERDPGTPSGASIRVPPAALDADSTGVPQHGRVVSRTDPGEEPRRVLGGLYPAAVLDNADPLGHQRLLVRIPELSGQDSVWAAACLLVPGGEEVPAIGAGIWVALEAGDPSRPVWLGRRVTR